MGCVGNNLNFSPQIFIGWGEGGGGGSTQKGSGGGPRLATKVGEKRESNFINTNAHPSIQPSVYLVYFNFCLMMSCH